MCLSGEWLGSGFGIHHGIKVPPQYYTSLTRASQSVVRFFEEVAHCVVRYEQLSKDEEIVQETYMNYSKELVSTNPNLDERYCDPNLAIVLY